jgi:hypothetical protein
VTVNLPINKNQGRYRFFKRPSLHGPRPKDTTFEIPRENQVKGEVRLGYIHNSRMIFGINKKEIVRHLLVCGASGSGKSNFLRIMQLELYRLGIPFLVFDTAKYGSRFLKNSMNDLIVLRWNKDFFLNPLQPPSGVNLNEWIMCFSSITSEIFGLRSASNLYLIEFIQRYLFGENNVHESNFPTMHILNRKLENRLKERIPINERGYINAIHSKIKAICLMLGEMINVHQGIPISDILKHPVCIELVGIKSSEIQYWIISLILAAISSYRETQPMAFGSLRHVFFIDECANVVGKGDI